jgi:hypothetical protein
MTLQSLKSLNRDSFETPFWESWDKKPLNVGAAERHKIYYMGEGRDFPQV